MIKPIFTDEFKQEVVDYGLEHPDESKVSIALKDSLFFRPFSIVILS